VLSDVFIAIKIGLLFDVDINLISKAISEYKFEDGRLNIIKKKYTIIDDSYNSSYESVIGGLNRLKSEKEFKFIILGDILELGIYSKKYHKKINKYLKRIKNKEVLLIGEYTKYIKGIHFNSVDEINEYLALHLIDNCIIYIKGSRKMNLDKIKTH
jgi:UDP-N-acetylmuramyl pentapeptide synthase